MWRVRRLSKGEARLDDGTDDGEILFMEGRCSTRQAIQFPARSSTSGTPTRSASTRSSARLQSPYNLRRRIETDRDGRYRFRSIMPSGYGCPPGSNTETLLAKMGRHGRRPAHIHFFVTAPGYRQLTTQINIDGDKYLHDDFAFGTRDDLIPPIERVTDAAEIHKAGLNKPFVRIGFDFRITREVAGAPATVVHREHAVAA